jgi:hypothetical protein
MGNAAMLQYGQRKIIERLNGIFPDHPRQIATPHDLLARRGGFELLDLLRWEGIDAKLGSNGIFTACLAGLSLIG